MSKQVYFVIGVDLDSKEAFIDDDTYKARFSDREEVWDTELNEWVQDPELELYAEALEILNNKPLASD